MRLSIVQIVNTTSMDAIGRATGHVRMGWGYWTRRVEWPTNDDGRTPSEAPTNDGTGGTAKAVATC